MSEYSLTITEENPEGSLAVLVNYAGLTAQLDTQYPPSPLSQLSNGIERLQVGSAPPSPASGTNSSFGFLHQPTDYITPWLTEYDHPSSNVEQGFPGECVNPSWLSALTPDMNSMSLQGSPGPTYDSYSQNIRGTHPSTLPRLDTDNLLNPTSPCSSHLSSGLSSSSTASIVTPEMFQFAFGRAPVLFSPEDVNPTMFQLAPSPIDTNVVGPSVKDESDWTEDLDINNSSLSSDYEQDMNSDAHILAFGNDFRHQTVPGVGSTYLPDSSSSLTTEAPHVDPQVDISDHTSTSTGRLYKERVAPEGVVEAAKKRRKNPKKLFHCPFERCDASFTAPHNLRYHCDSHLGIRRYTCKKCDAAFTTPYVRNRHLKVCKG